MELEPNNRKIFNFKDLIHIIIMFFLFFAIIPNLRDEFQLLGMGVIFLIFPINGYITKKINIRPIVLTGEKAQKVSIIIFCIVITSIILEVMKLLK